jgi:stearoyl-CoA 9-desaturase NADPH oxidoreductase
MSLSVSLAVALRPLHRDYQRMSRFFLSARTRARRPLTAILRTRVARAACTPRSPDEYLELFDRTWSLRRIRARIVAVEHERGGATSLLLAPNENWRSFRPGQYVRLSVRIAGVRYDRCFSLSSAPGDRHLRVTIRRLPGARVGQWAAAAAHVGGVVELSQALGDFVLPDPLPPRLLFISAGSGITPVLSMLRHLVAERYDGEITCLHYAPAEVILGDELAELVRRHPALRFVPIFTRAPVQSDRGGELAQRHFSAEQLHALAPSWRQCETFVCGPSALEAEVSALFEAHGLAGRLHVERFVAAVEQRLAADDTGTAAEDVRCRLVFAASGRAVDGHGGASLLEQAEHAGLRPAHGCRMGICHTCKCKKLSGVVRNRLTGAVSSEPGEEIQLCISTPRSDVTLDL